MTRNKFIQFGTLIVILGIQFAETVESYPMPRIFIKTGRSRIRIADSNTAGRSLMMLVQPTSLGMPVINLGPKPISSRSALNPDQKARFGCQTGNGRCFFGLFGGGDDYSRPVYQPPMDYYEVCDEYYDPYNDSFVEDCTSNTPDYYY